MWRTGSVTGVVPEPAEAVFVLLTIIADALTPGWTPAA
jgi:hypothetical protein